MLSVYYGDLSFESVEEALAIDPLSFIGEFHLPLPSASHPTFCISMDGQINSGVHPLMRTYYDQLADTSMMLANDRNLNSFCQ